MLVRFQWSAILLFASLLTGCSIHITDPPNGSTVNALPHPLQWTESGTSGVDTITMDGNNLTNINGATFQWGPGGSMFTVPPGSHSVTVTGQTGWGNVSDTSNFTVAANACPLCYICPANQFLHAFNGMCCTGSRCDVLAYTNFGFTMLNAAACSGSQANDCMNQNADGLCGGSSTGCTNLGGTVTQTLAVSFSPSQNGALAHIQVPISSSPGNPANQFEAWITADNNGKPGMVLETFPLNNIRTFNFPTQNPLHIFSTAHPALSAGTTYWLVIGPAAANAAGSWNMSLADTPTAGSSNFLVNNTGPIPSINGPWTPAGGAFRTAFEIDVR